MTVYPHHNPHSEVLSIDVDECRQLGIDVLPPDVNESFRDFGVVTDSIASGKPRIRFGLLAVKGLSLHFQYRLFW